MEQANMLETLKRLWMWLMGKNEGYVLPVFLVQRFSSHVLIQLHGVPKWSVVQSLYFARIF
ncbi:hypothetical protein RHGRI_035741 [Rhododendron griersonianum]|uniref:Uncharacterized protein n=1 Tax=Rhododendron griersonianum TaxID=479676 RepID=A0AAV6HN72_9ERIC|nr:hypothetical protein RHGRI_035741 [Rhododendron griersonianum]